MFAACVKLHATGPPMTVHLTLEEFDNGKPRELGGSESAQDQPNEFSVTLRPASDANGRLKKSHVVVAQQSEHRYTDWVLGIVPLRKASMNRATIETDVAVPTLSGPSLPATQALTTPSDLTPDHPVAILGWFEGRGASSTSGGETIEQKAARVEWAFVVKLKLRSIERRPRRRWREAGPMPGKANWKQRIRGVIGAGLLAVVCVYLSAACIAWQDSPAPIHYLWPHLDPLLAPLVLAPAVALWWYYFTYHWRGLALLGEVAAVTIKQPRFWLYLVLAFVLCWLLMMQPAVRSAA